MKRVLVIVALAFAGCGDDGIQPPASPDTGEDATNEDSSGDTEDGAEADSEGDLSVEPDADDGLETGGSCENQWDCENEFFCAAGTCYRMPACGAASNWIRCVNGVEELQEGLGYRAACDHGFCNVLCEVDEHCPENFVCTDYGVCLEWDGDITGEHPGNGERAALQVGFGEALFQFPVGVPMAGYGSRAAFDEGRYALSLQPSTGQAHGLFVRAVLIDNGDRQLMLIRAPTIFPSMVLHEQVARALQAETGRDWRDSLVLSSTHTHSGPARYWHVPSDAALALGALGVGEFSQEIYDLHRETFIEAALDALDNSGPAQLGWEIVEAYDTDDHIGRDRWEQTPPFDDNRLLLIRIDDADGIPQVVLFSFGAHGTDNSESYLSGDVLYGAERQLEFALGEEFGRFVPALFINQNSGSMSPAGGSVGHRYPQTVERFGLRFVEKMFEDLLAIETSDDITLDARTYRFPISFDLLEYDENFASPLAQYPVGGVYRYGAIECTGGRFWADEDYSTHGDADSLSCIALHFLLHNRSPSMFSRSQITALDIAGLRIVTMPGELAMELSWQVLRELRDEYELDPLEAWTWGYSQDHLLYLMPTDLTGELPPFPGISTPKAPDEYDDFAFSYLQGGYEPGLSPWGPRLGDYLVDRAVEAYGLLVDDDFEPRFPDTMPSFYSIRAQEPFPIDEDDAEAVGTIVTDMPELVRRLEAVEFAWIGGDPGAEQPQTPLVILERETAEDTFEEVLLPNFRRYDNRALRFMTRVREGDDGWEWVARWEEMKDFPQGRYRFRVEGHFQNEGERDGYTLTSRIFELQPIDDVIVTAAGDGDSVCGTLGYPPPDQMRWLEPLDDPGVVTGHFRMRHYLVGTGISDPLETDSDVIADGVTLVLRESESVVATEDATFDLDTEPETVAGRGGVPVTRYCFDFAETLGSGDYEANVSVIDQHGNSGGVTVEFTIP
jgi:hypothetical protein